LTQILPPEEDIVQGLLDGSETMFKLVFTAYAPSLYAVARSIAGESNADEVIQEAWIKAYKALPNFQGRSAFKSWLTRIVANEAKSKLRKHHRESFIDDITTSIDNDNRFDSRGHWNSPTSQWHTDSPEALLTSDELKNCIDKNLQNLPPNQQSVIQLREAHGHSLEEICNILDISASNVRVLLHRAKDKILQVVDKFERTGEC
jgi:RNA polymerase sigma-70 factor, ECF subfamily